MTRKDYNEIARVMHVEYTTAVMTNNETLQMSILNMARSFCDYFKVQNSAFNAERFILAIIGKGE